METANLFKEEKGAALVIVAAAMAALIGVAALVIDVGNMFLQDMRLSNAVDAAALAGAQVLHIGDAEAINTAEYYALQNGINSDDVQVSISEDSRALVVSGQRRVDFTLAKIFGFNSTDLNKTCKAMVGNLISTQGIVPISIEDQILYFGEDYILKYGAGGDPGGAYHSGWFGALALGAQGASVYEENLKYGYQSVIKIAEILDEEPGNISGKTTAAIEYRLSQCKHTPSCTYDNFAPGCPRVVMVPVVKPYDHKEVEVVGFAAFFLEGVGGQGVDNYITGKFIKTIAPGEISTAGDNDYGLYGVKLVE